MRLGYFGGSFDPPHYAHRRAAELALQHFALDRVLLAPTGRQPLKSGGAEAAFAERLHMVELLCAGHPALQASDIDGPRPGNAPNYTVDTLRRLRNASAASPSLPRRPVSPPELFAIVGADAFLGLRQWRDPDELLRLAQWIVISRPGFALETTSLHLSPAQQGSVHLLPGLDNPVSATEIRARLHTGQSCRTLIPPTVLRYIRTHGLYRQQPEQTVAALSGDTQP